MIVTDDVFDWTDLPGSVAVFGAGVIGLELGRCTLRMSVKDAERLGIRDGGEALGLAKSLVGESGPRNHTSFDTMAAACAELGDFDAAVRWQRRAIRDCPDEVRAEYEARLRLYESQTPYRSSAL